MTSPAFRCADAARDRGDSPLGTAPLTAAYLLIEHRGPWRFDALAGAGWSTGVVDALSAAVRESRGRLLLIRRPGRRPRSSTSAWAVSRVGGLTQWGTWTDERELLVAADVLRATAASSDQLPSTARPSGSSDPVVLVCAHGIHDTCCAVRGRPVAAALAAEWPEATWECSHIGGDRFAANIVVLPDGIYYGTLDAGSAVRVVGDHLAGRVDPRHLRGSVRWPPPVQVAVGAVHQAFGPYAADDVRAERWTERPGSRWLVDVSTADDRRCRVMVVAHRAPPAVLTCAATRATSATSYRVESIDCL